MSNLNLNSVTSLDTGREVDVSRVMQTVDYVGGLVIDSRDTVVVDGDDRYVLAASAVLPYTTTGAGMPEGGAFVSVGDAALRQELADGTALVSSSTGTQAVGEALDFRLIQFDSFMPPTSGEYDPERFLFTSTKIKQGAVCHTRSFHFPLFGLATPLKGGCIYEINIQGNGPEWFSLSGTPAGIGAKALLDKPHIYQLGAYGNGVDDDHDAANRAAQIGVPIDCTGGIYRLSQTVDIPHSGMKFYSRFKQRPSANIDRAAKFIVDAGNYDHFRVYQADCVFSNIAFYGQGRDNSTGTAIRMQRKPGQGRDIDCRIDGCEFDSLGRGFIIYGRGLHITNSSFSGLNIVGSIDWPTDSIPNGQSNDTDETGARSYIFDNLLFHGNLTGITNEGWNAQNVRGIVATTILADIGGGEGNIFRGVLVEGNLTNITSVLNAVTNGLPLKLLAGSRKSQIANFNFGGFQSSETTRLSHNLIRIESSESNPTEDLKFVGGSIGPCRRDGIQLVTTSGTGRFIDIMFSNVSFDRCGLTGGGYSPVSILSDGSSVLGDTSVKFGACTFDVGGTAPSAIVAGDDTSAITIYTDSLTAQRGGPVPWVRSNVNHNNNGQL